MSSATGTNAASSSGNGTSAASSGPSGTATASIRDFVYLNQDRIFSYLSQIEGGLKLLYTKVQQESWSETVTSPDRTTDVGLSASGTMEGKVAFLAGITGEIGGEWKHSVKTGGDARTDSERRSNSELFGVHHKAFDLLMDKLPGRFTIHQGDAAFIHMDFLIQSIQDFPSIIKDLNKLTTGQQVNTVPNTKEMSSLLRRYYSGKILVLLRRLDGVVVTAYLNENHLLDPIDSILVDYGSAPTMPFTLVGIDAPPQSQATAGLFSVNHFEPSGQAMAGQLSVFASSITGMREFFEIRSTDSHIIPLALYTEV